MVVVGARFCGCTLPVTGRGIAGPHPHTSCCRPTHFLSGAQREDRRKSDSIPDHSFETFCKKRTKPLFHLLKVRVDRRRGRTIPSANCPRCACRARLEEQIMPIRLTPIHYLPSHRPQRRRIRRVHLCHPHYPPHHGTTLNRDSQDRVRALPHYDHMYNSRHSRFLQLLQVVVVDPCCLSTSQRK
jgi:hypothetical protein